MFYHILLIQQVIKNKYIIVTNYFRFINNNKQKNRNFEKNFYFFKFSLNFSRDSSVPT